ncbi:MAG: phage late control D family protein, partial [Tannerella sp.]|nr:phage late control D family protein [Tannerella sp.]
MAEDLNKVDTELTVAGAKTHFVSLHLNQSFNSHHSFEIEIDYENLDEKWMESPAKLIDLIGEPVNITMKHKQTGEENLFEGIITNVSMSGYHGQQNAIVITGKSPTIKLDGKETMDSFMDKTLQQIVDEAVSNSGNGGSVTSKPVFGGKLDYVCQYNETCFELINRLSWIYGEWFFYNGQETFFGKPGGGKVAEITYDKEMTSFNLSANLMPPKFNRYYYLHHDDKEIDQYAPESVDGVEGYLQKSLDMSKKVYTSKANIPLNPNVTTKKELEDMAEVEKSRATGEMLIMRGGTQTCKIKIGEKVKI